MDDITVLIAHRRGARADWLKEAVASIPPGVPHLILENDGELAEALNAGLAAATTEFVIRLDDDDLFDDDLLPKLHDAIWDVDVAYPDLLLVSEDLKYISRHEAGPFCPNRLRVQNFIGGAGTLMRRESVLAVGGYRDLPALEDWDLWVRMDAAGYKFKSRPDAVYNYRQNQQSRNRFSAADREALKTRIVGAEPRIEATWYAQETVATSYWRCILPARYLPGQVVLHRPTVQIDGDDIGFPHHRGAAIFQFPGLEYERFAMAAMQEQGIRVLIETDDNYLTPLRIGKQWIKAMPTRRDLNLRPSNEMHRRIARWCDGVIVATEQLARQYRRVTDAPVFVCPNQIDPHDWETEAPMPDWHDPNKTYVGMVGSASHLPDVKLIGQALEWAAKQPGVEVVLMGLYPKQLVGRFPFRYVPWTTDLGAYRAIQRVFDIALCPVVGNIWANCRSDLKPLELAMSGAASVLSDAEPYRGWTDGQGCRKAATAKDFLRVTRELVNGPDATRDLAAEAKGHVLAERTHAANSWRWAEAAETPMRELIAA